MNTYEQPHNVCICYWQLYNGFRNGEGICPYYREDSSAYPKECYHAAWHEKAAGCKDKHSFCQAMSPTCVQRNDKIDIHDYDDDDYDYDEDDYDEDSDDCEEDYREEEV